jgi:hypothetical protein
MANTIFLPHLYILPINQAYYKPPETERTRLPSGD